MNRFLRNLAELILFLPLMILLMGILSITCLFSKRKKTLDLGPW